MEYVAVGIVSKLRFATNALTPVNRLPPEILCDVFFHLRPVIRGGSKRLWQKRQPFEDLLVVTNTCQHWRAIAITTPDLWSQLIIREPCSNFDDATRLFIDRSGELPLDADVGYGLAVVAPHTNRLRTLWCKGYAISESPNLSDRPAPLLEELHILPHWSETESPPLQTLFDRDSPSLRRLTIDGYKPWPNNHFGGLSSFHLQLSTKGDAPTVLIPLLAMLRDSPQLEELSLCLCFVRGILPSPHGIPTRATLYTLKKLHFRYTAASLVRQFLGSVDLARNGIAMQFTNIALGPHRVFPATLPPEMSLRAATSLEIIYIPGGGLIIQGTNPGMRIRVVGHSDSDGGLAEIFSLLVRLTSPQFPLRELWIHVEREGECKLPPLPRFSHLEKLAVRSTVGGSPIRQLLRMLDTDRNVSCPLPSTIHLLGSPATGDLLKILKARSDAGYRLERLGLRKVQLPLESIAMLRGYVGELELFSEEGEPCGMELPAVCMEEIGEWWEPWTKHRVAPLIDGRFECVEKNEDPL